MAFVIPSIFTAIDRISNPVRSMGGAVTSTANRMERSFNRVSGPLSGIKSQLLGLVGTAAIVAGAFALFGYAKGKVVEFEKGLASFRTIVSDLSDTEFAKFRAEVFNVAKDTRKASVDVVASFEKIAGLNADFAKTSKGLGLVSTAAITLAKASGDELGTSAENLVGIMNQFAFGAAEANRTINVLAAGQAVGAANISQTAEALKIFGAVAKGSNATIEQSVGLIETLAQKSIMGSEAGTALRGVFVRLQKAGLGYKSGQFQINDALVAAKQKVDSLSSAKAKDAYITKLFGLENLTAGRILLDSIDTFKTFTASVTGTSEAQKAAEINSNTLSNRISELGNKFTNLVTGSDTASKSLTGVKTAVVFLTEHMETIISVGTKVLIFYGAWQALLVTTKIAMVAYNVILGLSIALQGKSAFYVMGNTIAYGAYRTAVIAATLATKFWTGVQWLLNAAFWACPITWIVAGVIALVAAIIWVASKTKGWGEQWDATINWMVEVFKTVYYYPLKLAFLGLVHAFTNMVDELVKAWYWVQNKLGRISDGAYKKNLAQIEAEKVARIAAINETVDALKKSAMNSANGPGWRVSWNDDEKGVAGSQSEGINPKTQQQQAFLQGFSDMQKQSAEITIKDQTGSAEVTKNPSGIPIKITPNVASWKTPAVF